MSKLSEVLTIVKKRDGLVPVGRDGEVIYVVKPLDEDNYDDIPDGLIEQLKQEHKYGYYISVCTRSVSVLSLPIYGDPNKFVTKWLYSSIEDCVRRDLRDRDMNLYNRIMEFEENKELLD